MKSDRFTNLLNLYLDDKATKEEREELMLLIQEGKHDDAIAENIDALLFHGQVDDEMDPQQAKKIRRGILSTAKGETKVIHMPAISSRWRWVASVAAAFMVAVWAGWWLFRVQPTSPRLVVAQEKKIGPVIFSGKQFVRLPDGSTVLLNDQSRLSYSAAFGEQVREVTLVGEGYFDIQYIPSKPFKVITGEITTTVLGTAFNVKAYEGQAEIKVTVSRGKVRVSDEERTLAIITPDQQIAINTVTDDVVQREVKAEIAEEWKSDYLILDDVTFEQAAETIAAKYNVKITVTNDELKKCRISATFLERESLTQVLTVVTTVVDASYEIAPDGYVIIEGKGCKRADSDFEP